MQILTHIHIFIRVNGRGFGGRITSFWNYIEMEGYIYIYDDISLYILNGTFSILKRLNPNIMKSTGENHFNGSTILNIYREISVETA